LVGIEGGVVSGVINLESSGVEASDWNPIKSAAGGAEWSVAT